MINSKRKGKTGELAAVKFLKSLGFNDARRTVQYHGVAGIGDVVCPRSLPKIHFEIKYGYDPIKFAIGSKLWWEAVGQARRDAKRKIPVVLWKPKHCRQWRLTLASDVISTAPTYPEEWIEVVLKNLC